MNSNFTDSQEKSLKFLKSRCESEGLAIYETDKTGSFVVDSLSNLESKMEPHVKNDKVINPSQTSKVETLLNSETESWINILQIGRDINHTKRTKFNLKSTKNPIPILRGTKLPKTLKKVMISDLFVVLEWVQIHHWRKLAAKF